jgi:hypothetical protein
LAAADPARRGYRLAAGVTAPAAIVFPRRDTIDEGKGMSRRVYPLTAGVVTPAATRLSRRDSRSEAQFAETTAEPAS